ncbi:nucleotide exchange factor GrpE [Actinophytocola oryzae]|uniref:nucleotide exchange factor GrpE n=1 Tax=Actinophytocola oryzae TaxID=502181 RepID=UPI001063639C|nr:nucleotide exchange factor GrpE [Actinophytocola oryzae]
MSSSKSDDHGEEPRVVVRDRRRIDPETGEVRAETAPEAGFGAPEPELAVTPDDEVLEAVPSQEAELKAQLDERTADLQRLQAEYANYRKRIDRDREAVVNGAKASVATELLSVLDDIERASQHGDLTGAFKAVADKLVATLERVGLESFGHDGEAFDPSVHEAVQHDTSPDVAGPTVTAVLRRGYRFGDRVVRAALVAVTDHEPAAPVSVSEEGMPSSEWYDPNNPDGTSADKD